jgi:hypothetical protein
MHDALARIYKYHACRIECVIRPRIAGAHVDNLGDKRKRGPSSAYRKNVYPLRSACLPMARNIHVWTTKLPWADGIVLDVTLVRVEDTGPNLITLQEVRVQLVVRSPMFAPPQTLDTCSMSIILGYRLVYPCVYMRVLPSVVQQPFLYQ